MTDVRETVSGSFGMRRAALAGLLVCALELALVVAFGGERLASLLTGAIAGALGGFVGLWLVGRALPGGLNEMLKAVVFGFLLRTLLVAVGLVAVLRSQGDAIAFVATFFPLFFAFAALEALVAIRAPRTPAA